MWKKIKKPIICLAPMAGITDSAFRLICKENGADMVYSEMANVSALYYKPKKTLNLIKFSPKEKPYVVQLFGKNPQHFARAANLISQRIPAINYQNKAISEKNKSGKISGIDINFGCPAKKVFSHGSGVFLMTKPKLSKKIIQAVVKNTHLPVSIKIRSGLEVPAHVKLKNSKKFIRSIDFLKKININNLGISAIMIHGRTYRQGFSGPMDFKAVKEIKDYFKGIVIANGNISNAAIAKETLEKTGSDGIGVATASRGNPEIFQQIQALKTKNNPPPVNQKIDWKQKFQIKSQNFLKQAYRAEKLKGKKGIIEQRKHFVWYFKGFPGIKKFIPQMVRIKNLKEIKKILNKIEESLAYSKLKKIDLKLKHFWNNIRSR
ncbi:MAG: hypothetical protein GF335_01870 [Candidatus Moranbacteria bacterium]|nr:hypothetical protein [Candidatus Moranbacteria bacterium]